MKYNPCAGFPYLPWSWRASPQYCCGSKLDILAIFKSKQLTAVQYFKEIRMKSIWLVVKQALPKWHWGRVRHICVVKLTIIGSYNGLSPGRRQAIIWTNGGILLIGPLGTNFSEILIRIQTFSFKKVPLKMSSAKWRPFGLGLNVLIGILMDVWNTPQLGYKYTRFIDQNMAICNWNFPSPRQ